MRDNLTLFVETLEEMEVAKRKRSKTARRIFRWLKFLFSVLTGIFAIISPIISCIVPGVDVVADGVSALWEAAVVIRDAVGGTSFSMECMLSHHSFSVEKRIVINDLFLS
jgi:hypothetical protein